MKSDVSETIEALNRGGVVLIPTDTVYGLAARQDDHSAVEHIYRIKKRDISKPFAVLISDIEYAWKLVKKTENAEKLCSRYWPGAVTLIFEAVNGGSIALRVPDCDLTRDIIRETGALSATSANMSGAPSPLRFRDIPEEILRQVDSYIEEDRLVSGKPSVIIDTRKENMEIIRY